MAIVEFEAQEGFGLIGNGLVPDGPRAFIEECLVHFGTEINTRYNEDGSVTIRVAPDGPTEVRVYRDGEWHVQTLAKEVKNG